MKVIFYILYVVLGLLQLAATIAGFTHWLNWPFIVVFLIGIPISYIPVIGQIIGIMGAVSAWGWSMPMAVALFVGPFAVYFAFAYIMSALDKRP